MGDNSNGDFGVVICETDAAPNDVGAAGDEAPVNGARRQVVVVVVLVVAGRGDTMGEDQGEEEYWSWGEGAGEDAAEGGVVARPLLPPLLLLVVVVVVNGDVEEEGVEPATVEVVASM